MVTIRLLSVAFALLLLPLPAVGGVINSAVFTRDGKSVALGLADKTLRIVEVPTGKQLHKITCAEAPFRLAMSPNGKTFASGEFNDLALYEVASGKEVARAKDVLGHLGINSLAFFPDGKTLAVAGNSGRAKLLDAATLKELRSLDGLSKIITSVTVSPDGKTVAAAGVDKVIGQWDAAAGGPSRTLASGKASYQAVHFTADGKQLVSLDDDAAIALWPTAGGEASAQLKADSGWTSHLAISPDGKTLAWDGKDYKVTLWDLGAKKALGQVVAFAGSATALAFSPDSKKLVVADYSGKVHLVDVSKATATEVPIPE